MLQTKNTNQIEPVYVKVTTVKYELIEQAKLILQLCKEYEV